jgi:carbonic anhydrase/acetyltransferase-like protein (isoleucine patch superfamily)
MGARMSLHPYRGKLPVIATGAFVAPTATLIGEVTVGTDASLWYGAVLRGDVEPIRIGERTSIQDNSVIHATGGWHPTSVGDDVTVGHGVILHGCIVHDRVIVGMGSIVLDQGEIGSDTILGAGSLVPPRKKIPSGVLAVGRPAKVVRELEPAELEQIKESARIYVALTHEYLAAVRG